MEIVALSLMALAVAVLAWATYPRERSSFDYESDLRYARMVSRVVRAWHDGEEIDWIDTVTDNATKTFIEYCREYPGESDSAVMNRSVKAGGSVEERRNLGRYLYIHLMKNWHSFRQVERERKDSLAATCALDLAMEQPGSSVHFANGAVIESMKKG